MINPDTAAKRCEAMMVDALPPYRCRREATADRRGRAVCKAHSRKLAIRYWGDDDVDVLAWMTNHARQSA
jgi:hypothetical protein